jgi:hypothetical protein
MSPRIPVASLGRAENRCPKASGTVSSMNVAQSECSSRLNQSWNPSPGERSHFWAGHEFAGVTGALVALRANGRAEFRPTEMPTNALCHLESGRPPAFKLSANGLLTRGDQISPRAGDSRSSAYSVPRPKKLLPLCVRYGCLRGGRMECFWSKNSICAWQAGVHRTRLRDDPVRTPRFDRICHCLSIAL